MYCRYLKVLSLVFITVLLISGCSSKAEKTLGETWSSRHSLSSEDIVEINVTSNEVKSTEKEEFETFIRVINSAGYHQSQLDIRPPDYTFKLVLKNGQKQSFSIWLRDGYLTDSNDGSGHYRLSSDSINQLISLLKNQKAYLDKEDVINTAKKFDADANWRTKFIEEYKDEGTGDIRPTWLVVATYGFGNETVVYVDALTGEPYAIKETEPPKREKYRPGELKDISAIRISGSIAQKTTTNQESINKVISVLEDAKFFGFRQAVDVQIEGKEDFLVYLIFKSGEEIPLHYWPGEDDPNLLDSEHQEWWTVEGFDRVMESLLPPKYLGNEDIRKVAEETYPIANFPQDEFTFRLIDKGEFHSPGDHIWYAVGITPSQERVGLYIDPVTGKVLRIEEPQSTAGAVKVVEEFYNLIAKGDYKSAWSLIHSRAQEPSPGADSQEIRKTFNGYFEDHQPKLKRVISAEWEPVWGKIPECMCWLDYAVKVTIELENRKKELHAVKDNDGQWRLFWSYKGELK